MYSNVDFGSAALTNSWRYNIGGGPGSYRHPSDIYDRIWEPHTYDNFVKMANESWVDWKTDDDTYGIPVEVLMTAGRSDNASTNLTVSWKPSGETWYIYFHLAEIQVLKTGQVREIGIYVMDQMVETVLPEYGKSKTVSSIPMSCPFEMNFTLSASPQSSLPPILNPYVHT
ncbi:hypothetical protein SAY87_017287 [Trapa incisa]|uniref:Malectin-like domain-containing protein n=1 Tax=Trapa incisa TaxID=236973 RepID=A0AAN7L8A0_9MYRT|nr:hypothetical protein SAY87_017287 [Trapa incisa]